MFERMSESEFNQYLKGELLIPVWGRIPASDLNSLSIIENLQKLYSRAVYLESPDQGGYCFACVDPFLHFESRDRLITIEGKDRQIAQFEADPVATLRQLIQENKAIDLPGHPPFIGGAVGYFAYDSIRLFEKIPDRHPNEENTPDILFNFYDTCLVYDTNQKTITIYLSIRPQKESKNLYSRTIREIERFFNLIKKPNQHSHSLPTKSLSTITVDVSDEDFKKKVQKAKHYIHEGDIFQVVLSRTFRKKTQAEPFDIFKGLYQVTPSVWMFYFKEPHYQIAGSSPERLVTLKNGKLKTNPLAGTLPRPEPEKQQEAEEELLNNPKENAEHMMLVDLGRNDIGSISVVGSVKVTSLKTILRLAHVIHISSEVEGIINPRLDCLDAIRATLPAGTLSGAPKIRAMQIIDELEVSRRGLYGGAICYIDNRGNLDSCIAIRMITISDGIATVRAGAGIVYDSVPQKEAEETKLKAMGALRAISLAEEGGI